MEDILELPKLIINDEFLKVRPLSYSSLKAFRKSPLHYIQYVTKPKLDSDAFALGSAIDILTLQPELFNAKFLVTDKPEQRSNAGKSEWQNILIEAANKKLKIITPDQLRTAKICVESLMSTNESRIIIEGKKKVQVKLSWTDKGTTLPLVGYVDFETKCWGSDFVVDLKSTKSADPNDFHRDIFKYGYDLQNGTYMAGYHKTQFRFPGFIFLAVETTEPYCVSVNYCESKFNDIAKDEFYGCLKAFRYCIDNQLFDKGYSFRLMNTSEYFAVRYPGWHKPTFLGFDDAEPPPQLASGEEMDYDLDFKEGGEV